MVVFSKHAAQRYQERVRPTLTVDQAAAELSLIWQQGTLSAHQPGWVGKPCEPHNVWLELGDSVCFPLTPHGGVLTATTCMARGTIPAPTRRARNRRRAARTYAKRVRRDPPGRPRVEVVG